MKTSLGLTMQLEYTILNIVATCDIGQNVNLESFARVNKDAVRYNPAVFRAAILRLPDPRTTFLVFHTGRIVITGVKSLDDLPHQALRVSRMLRLQIKLDGACIIVFSSGKIIVTGLKHSSALILCYSEMQQFIVNFGTFFMI
uniref:TATA-box-binding protein n=1 Tax=Panagrellus redivivus TaxID=6233 RepID=A0A7E4VQW2_PANRE